MGRGYRSTATPSKKAAVFYAAYFAVLGVVMPFLGLYLVARGLGPVAIGVATAAFSLSKVVYTPFAAARIDRGGWFPGLLSGHLALAVVGTVATAFVDSPVAIAISLFVAGLGFGTVLPLVEAAVLERLAGDDYGRLRQWGSIGFIAAAVISAALLGAGRLRWFPLLVTVALLLLAASCRPFERAARPTPATPDEERTIPSRVWWLLAILTANQAAHGPYYAFFSVRLADAGMSSVEIAVLWGLSVGAELLAFSFGNRFERLLGRDVVLSLALGLTPLRWLLLAAPVSVPLVVLAQCGHAASFALTHLAGVQLVQWAVPPRATRHAQALYSGLCFGLGIVVGAAAAGPLWSRFGGGTTYLAAAALSFTVALAWLVVSRRFAAADVRRSRT